jgi:hypothetical protein
MTELLLTFGGGAVVIALVIGLTSSIASVVLHATKLLADGTVSLDGTNPAAPKALADAAGLDVDTLALARMITSEAGGLPTIGKLAVAFATLTHAAAAKKTLSALLLHSNGAGDGYFGRQSQGRYAATSHDHTAAALAAAQAAIGGEVDDPSDGSDQWDSPHAYRDDPVKGTAEEQAAAVEQARLDAGKEQVTIAGISPTVIRFWRSA